MVQQRSSEVRPAPPGVLPQVRLLAPSKGPIVEQYLAEEALGLAKSLGWTVLQGPFWKQPRTDSQFSCSDLPRQKNQLFVEGDVEEIQDGDYIKTSLGSGTVYVVVG